MEKFKKFLKALELVVPQGIYSLGLIINKSGKRIMWARLPYKIDKIEINENCDQLELLKQIYKSLKSGQWLVLDLKTVMPSQVYAQLRQLSLNNHLQINHKDKMIELKQSPKSRVIVTGSYEIIKENQQNYQEMKNLFGPVISV